MIDVTIIIVNYNTTGLVSNCLKSIYSNSFDIAYEILVVDNASPDTSIYDLSFEFNNESTSFIFLSENRGFGGANNVAIQKAQGKYLFFLNPDTILLNNAISILMQHLDKSPLVGACGGNLYNEELLPTHSFRRVFPSVFYEFNDLCHTVPELLRFGKNRDFNYTNKILNVAYITGADLMIPRKIIDLVGAFDERFFMYFEESELCKRIKNRGLFIQNCPTARIQHLEGRSCVVNEKKIQMFLLSRTIFYNMQYSVGYVKIANVVYGLNVVLRAFCSKSIKRRLYFQSVLKEFI